MKSVIAFGATALTSLALILPVQAGYVFTEPDDIQGVLSDTIVPSGQLCQSLCDENDRCLSILYHYECDECWQLDCSTTDRSYDSSKVMQWKKTTGQEFSYCEDDQRPVLPKNGCSNLNATATITSLGQATETGSGGDGGKSAAALGKEVGLMKLGAALLGAVAFINAA